MRRRAGILQPIVLLDICMFVTVLPTRIHQHNADDRSEKMSSRDPNLSRDASRHSRPTSLSPSHSTHS
jgi:hypothetical protein